MPTATASCYHDALPRCLRPDCSATKWRRVRGGQAAQVEVGAIFASAALAAAVEAESVAAGLPRVIPYIRFSTLGRRIFSFLRSPLPCITHTRCAHVHLHT